MYIVSNCNMHCSFLVVIEYKVSCPKLFKKKSFFVFFFLFFFLGGWGGGRFEDRFYQQKVQGRIKNF